MTAGIECMLGSAMYLKSTGISLKRHTHTINNGTITFKDKSAYITTKTLKHSFLIGWQVSLILV